MCNDRPMEEARSVHDCMIEGLAKCRAVPRPDHFVIEEVAGELRELSNKINSLDRFLKSDPPVSEPRKELLKSQLKAMKEYAKVLCLRIMGFAVAIKEGMEESSDSE